MAQVIGISHIAYNVKDLDRSIEFYCKYLNFEKAFDIRIPDNIEDYIPGTPLVAIIGLESLVYLKAPDGSYLELFRPLPEYNLSSGGPNYTNMGYVHLSLQVDDLDGFVEELRANGIQIDSEKEFGPDNTYTIWIKDPDGNRIELMEYTDRSLQKIYSAKQDTTG